MVHGRREPRNVPIYIGATGDQMMELTGEIADGAVLNYCVPPEYNDKAMELLDKGARKAGRTVADLDRPQLVVCSVDADRHKAIENAKVLLTQYLAQQPHIAKASGVPEDVVKKVQSILGWPATREQVHEAMQYVPDEFVLKISATGTPAEARAKVQEYIDRGCTCPILYPMSDPQLMIDTFAVQPAPPLGNGKEKGGTARWPAPFFRVLRNEGTVKRPPGWAVTCNLKILRRPNNCETGRTITCYKLNVALSSANSSANRLEALTILQVCRVVGPLSSVPLSCFAARHRFPLVQNQGSYWGPVGADPCPRAVRGGECVCPGRQGSHCAGKRVTAPADHPIRLSDDALGAWHRSASLPALDSEKPVTQVTAMTEVTEVTANAK